MTADPSELVGQLNFAARARRSAIGYILQRNFYPSMEAENKLVLLRTVCGFENFAFTGPCQEHQYFDYGRTQLTRTSFEGGKRPWHVVWKKLAVAPCDRMDSNSPCPRQDVANEQREYVKCGSLAQCAARSVHGCG